MSNNKYSRRALPSVSREDSTASWIDDFIGNLEKVSVTSQSDAQRSIYEDISAIIGNTKSKFSNVEEAVKDLKERTGLNALLKARASLESTNVQEPDIFKEIPEMKIFIDNFIDSRPGTSVESVIHDLMKLDHVRNKLPDRSDVDDGVRSYINGRIGNKLTETTDHNKVDLHIGKVDQSTPATTDDPLAICEPAKQQ
jgi:hypothetical protein